MPERGKHKSSQEKLINRTSNNSHRYQLTVKNHKIYKETKHEWVQAGFKKNKKKKKNQTHGIIR